MRHERGLNNPQLRGISPSLLREDIGVMYDSPMRAFSLVIAISASLLAQPGYRLETPTPTDAAVTNESIVRMIQAGISGEIIAAAIQRTSTPLDASPAALVRLKQAGASDEVLRAVIERAAGPVAPLRESTPTRASAHRSRVELSGMAGLNAAGRAVLGVSWSATGEAWLPVHRTIALGGGYSYNRLANRRGIVCERTCTSLSVKASIHDVLAGVRAQYPGRHVAPYLLATLGPAKTTVDVRAQSLRLSESGSALAIGLGGGLSGWFSSHAGVRVELRWIRHLWPHTSYYARAVVGPVFRF